MGADMRARVRERAQQAGVGGEVVPTRVSQAPAQRTIVDEIRSMTEQFQLAMPKGAEADQLIRDAITAVRTTRNLDQCDSASVLGSLMTAAQLGLRVGVLGQCWVLPFWDAKRDNGQGKPKGGHRAQFIAGYQGLVELAYRSPQVKSVIGRMVRVGETFDVDFGTDEKLIHKPNLIDDVGDITNYYVKVHTTNGGVVFYTMNRRQAESYRDKYAPRNKDQQIVGPWVSNFDDMALKSCLRQLAKWMPKSTALATAIEADGRVRLDTSGDVLTAASRRLDDERTLEGEVGEPAGAAAGGAADDA